MEKTIKTIEILKYGRGYPPKIIYKICSNLNFRQGGKNVFPR